MEQAHVFISGFVQGVGFRQFIATHARQFGIKGFVKNLPDRRVEVLAQGSRPMVEELIKKCTQGPPVAKVTDVSVTWGRTFKPFPSFTIL